MPAHQLDSFKSTARQLDVRTDWRLASSCWAKVKSLALVFAVLLISVLACSGQQNNLSDEQASKAATKAFTTGGWNPKIFEAKPIKVRLADIDKVLSDSSQQELKKDLLKEFGKGPCTVVTYMRRPETLTSNGGASYCGLHFLVFSDSKVAIIDSRVNSCPEDKLPKKTP